MLIFHKTLSLSPIDWAKETKNILAGSSTRLLSPKNWDDETKKSAVSIIKIVDDMFQSILKVAQKALALATTIGLPDKNFGTNYLIPVTGKESWLDVDLESFKQLVSSIMEGEYEIDGNNAPYYKHIETHGKKEIHTIFHNKSYLNSGVIKTAKFLYKPGFPTPLEGCFPKQHGRLAFSALIILSWISKNDAEFSERKNKVFTIATDEDIKKYYTSYTSDGKKRLCLHIDELDKVVTDWANPRKS